MTLGCDNVIVTLGENGSYPCNRSTALAVPGFIMKEVKDTTSADDGFNAGLALALSEGKSLPEAVRFASAVGGLSVTQLDTVPSCHFRDEVEAFLNSRSAFN